MHFKILLLSSLACLASSAAIEKRWQHQGDPSPVVNYLNIVNRIISSSPSITIDDCAAPPNSNLPVAPTPLPPPSPGLSVYHVAIGRGLQNYTCGTDPSATPTPIGALATLYNVTCRDALAAETVNAYPSFAVTQPNPPITKSGPSVLPQMNLLGAVSGMSGHHYFSDSTTPVFNLNIDTTDLGIVFTAKKASSSAPADAPASVQDGSKAVTWLKLLVDPTKSTGNPGEVKEVYRVQTAGGAAPANCAANLGQSFSKQYAAEYWFFH